MDQKEQTEHRDFLRAQQLLAAAQRLGYTFADLSLLDAALTHTSYVKGDGYAREHNERLEFLGDAVLELCVSEYIYRNYPKLNEGVMTRARAATVCESALYRAALDIRIGEGLRLSHGEEHSGGREKPSILADAVEAAIGAVFLDGGMEAARALVLRLTKEQIISAVSNVDAKDYKTMLQEYVQKRHKGNVSYELLDTKGPDHNKTFVLRAIVAGQPMGAGQGSSKQDAGQAAAKETLAMLGVPHGEETH
ncbi:MAG: ribonuclease III [Christensenellaceae bacterium]|jgi:ribonuclease-3|nr:ribonuclease III [Christensenellaceae bacterium]